METTYHVVGMTCGHCVSSVTGEVSKVPAVTDVAVDLPTGTMTVTSSRALDDTLVESAVTDAGYTLSGQAS
ncbi:heavy-metal-associated domain-containing protein [Actinotalea solisilvae]|uniref:heavy-metal-associated domain-containing protein n=1 Tax=Actinotalea solisilvae TaxID=2072922 RepID=UPI0018F1D7AB|nr:heavy-metal-associated domain-containing protein [Actinotalea solisilvae]